MRGRFSRFFGSFVRSAGPILEHPVRTAAMAAATTVAGIAVREAYREKTINTQLDTHKKMRDFATELKSSFKEDNADNEAAVHSFNALIGAITKKIKIKQTLKATFQKENKNNSAAYSEFISLLHVLSKKNPDKYHGEGVIKAEKHLKKIAEVNGVLSPEIRDNLVTYAVNHGKIEIVELLAQTFGMSAVLGNRRARKLLQMSPADKERAKNIKVNFNLVVAEDMLNDLIRHGAVVTEEVRDGLIAYASCHSKIAILELMQKVFGEEEVLRNDHARALLSLSDEEKAEVTHYLEEFYQSPGKIRHDGMVKFVQAKQEDLLEKHLQYRTYNPSFIFIDPAIDIAEGYRHVRSVEAITAELRDKFKHTLVLDLSDHPACDEIFEEYMKQLSHDAHAEHRPIIGTFVLTGAHFTLGQMKVTEHGEESDAEIVYLDPKGTYTSMQTNDWTHVASLPHHVFPNVTLWISEERNQLAGMGCSLFVADQYGTMMTLDQIMAKNTQYSFAGQEGSIFYYARQHKTSEFIYGIDYDGSDGGAGTYRCLGTFTLFVLPAALIVGKQSLNAKGELTDTPEEFVQEANGRFTSVTTGENKKLAFPGVMGVNNVRKYSSPERQQEFKGPADISCTKTVDEAFSETIEQSEHKGSVAPRNKKNDNSAYELGFFMSKHLSAIVTRKAAERPNISLNDAELARMEESELHESLLSKLQ